MALFNKISDPPISDPPMLWLYTEPLPLFGLSKAWFLWWCNAVAMTAHLGFAVVAIYVGSKGGGMQTPVLSLYLEEVSWTERSSSSAQFDFEPSFRQLDGGLQLAWMTTGFFLLSALAHAIVVVFNWPSTSRAESDANWYYRWIQTCMNPLRWVEYAFSASLMMLTIAYTSGIRGVYLLMCLTGLTFVTMTFGWLTEELSRPLAASDDVSPPVGWQIASPWMRLLPHFLGWIPYVLVWVILLHTFYWNTRDERDRMPSFVEPLVIAQFVIFTMFGVVQMVQQCVSPRLYYWGEVAYCALSLTAKAYLGATLIVNTFMFTSFDEVNR